MAELKTFLFTDIVGSVEFKRAMPGNNDADRDRAFIDLILTPHRERIERELAALGGRVVSTAGDGHFLVFSDTILAARWAIDIQQSHRDDPIRPPGAAAAVAVRISMHIGIPQTDPRDENNFVGKPVDYAARLNDYATGGQILASRSVVAVLEDAGMNGVKFHLHGQRDLRGIGQVDIYELVYEPTGPHKMRPQPRKDWPRQWTVLPATIGLTEFQNAGSQPRSDVALASPKKLGNYELVERLGGGGMGDVYKARHSQFGRDRAVKVIKSHFVEAGHQEVIRRFYQEIKAVGTLEHPNIVVAIDSSTPSDAVHYLVMEYIDGIGADELVGRGGPLPVADACEIARQAARGLAYIHQHGMVHRDIKPSNLMLTVVPADGLGSDLGGSKEPSGQRPLVKILDLGLALLVGDDQQRLTVFDDRAMGTAMYMSPEQWKTTSVDIRADIYSLGCTLYHLLAGKPPYWDSDLRPEKAHERETLPPIRGPHQIPRPLWDVLEKMTAKRPDDRYNDPAEAAAALAPFAQGHQLVRLIDRAKHSLASAATGGLAESDTRMARTVESDTIPGRGSAAWNLPGSFPPQSVHVMRRVAAWIGLVAAIATIAWLIFQTSQRRRANEDLIQAHRQSLILAASYATSEILKEINTRFDILTDLSKDPDLQQMMTEIDAKPKDETLWKAVDEKLGSARADNDKLAKSESWFINDSRGIQVARSPRSDTSRGDDFSRRDYFNGLGPNLSADAPQPKPIDKPHLSVVYRSTSTLTLKVAFSVPIENGRSGDDRKVVGVLAMSVDLGQFNVLEKDLPKDTEVVLIDLREANVDDQLRRGLVLHRQSDSFAKGEAPPWIEPALLEHIEKLLADDSATAGGLILTDYRDPALTDDKPYWGALKAVIDHPPEGPPQNLQWLVLVQEPLTK